MRWNISSKLIPEGHLSNEKKKKSMKAEALFAAHKSTNAGNIHTHWVSKAQFIMLLIAGPLGHPKDLEHR